MKAEPARLPASHAPELEYLCRGRAACSRLIQEELWREVRAKESEQKLTYSQIQKRGT